MLLPSRAVLDTQGVAARPEMRASTPTLSDLQLARAIGLREQCARRARRYWRRVDGRLSPTPMATAVWDGALRLNGGSLLATSGAELRVTLRRFGAPMHGREFEFVLSELGLSTSDQDDELRVDLRLLLRVLARLRSSCCWAALAECEWPEDGGAAMLLRRRLPSALDIARALQVARVHADVLCSLDLSQNRLGPVGAEMVAEILPRCSALTFLSLEDCDLTGRAAMTRAGWSRSARPSRRMARSRRCG